VAQVTLGAPHKRSLLVWEMLADNHSLGVEPYKNPTRAKEARVGHPAITPPAWVTQGESTTVAGPFINASGGGDVPRGDEVYVLTINDRNMRDPNQ